CNAHHTHPRNLHPPLFRTRPGHPPPPMRPLSMGWRWECPAVPRPGHERRRGRVLNLVPQAFQPASFVVRAFSLQRMPWNSSTLAQPHTNHLLSAVSFLTYTNPAAATSSPFAWLTQFFH